MVSWNDGDNDSSEDSLVYVTSSDGGSDKVNQMDPKLGFVNWGFGDLGFVSLLPQLPATIHDLDFCGIDQDVAVLCDHGKPAERFVAFEGMNTGRRFLGCSEKEGINCGVIQWIDFEWPASMEKALDKLWDMYEETKATRISDNLESSFTIHDLTEQQKKLQGEYDKLVTDVHELLDAQENRAVVDFSYHQKHKEIGDELEVLKAQLAKKEEKNHKLEGKYETLKNLTIAQGNVIRTLKFNHLKEKESLTHERQNLKFHISELQKSEEKLKLKLDGMKAMSE